MRKKATLHDFMQVMLKNEELKRLRKRVQEIRNKQDSFAFSEQRQERAYKGMGAW